MADSSFLHKKANGGTTVRHTEIDRVSDDARRIGLGHQLTPWLLDIAALVTSIASIAAILALLARFDGKPAPEWHHVTLNSAIGFLAQVAQTCLTVMIGNGISQLKWSWFWDESRPKKVADFQLFDSASRGAIGALLMVFRGWKWPITLLGAVLTISALVIQPFLQNVPIYRQRHIGGTGNSSIGRATHFTSITTNIVGADDPQDVAVLESGPKGAFYAGLFNYSDTFSLPATCSSGNCTWSTYTSLAVCSACTNVSSLLSATEVPGYDFPDEFYQLPNNMSIEASLNSMAIGPANTLRYSSLQNYSIADIFSLYFGIGTYTGLGVLPNTYECLLYFCVNTYSASVSSGVLEETILWSFPNATTPIDEAEAGINIPDGAADSPRPTSTVYLGGVMPNISIHHPEVGETYTIDNDTFALLREWVQGELQGSIASDSGNAAAMTDIEEVLYLTQIAEDGPTILMNRVASSLTAYLRTSTSETALGSVLTVQTYVYARWGWAVFPLVVLMLTLIFLVSTIIIGILRDIPTWRSSAIPPLVFSLDGATAAAITQDGPVLKRLEKRADKYLMAMSTGHELRLEGTPLT